MKLKGSGKGGKLQGLVNHGKGLGFCLGFCSACNGKSLEKSKQGVRDLTYVLTRPPWELKKSRFPVFGGWIIGPRGNQKVYQVATAEPSERQRCQG